MTDTLIIILICGIGLLVLGYTLIGHWFKQKEEFVERLEQRMKGKADAQRE